MPITHSNTLPESQYRPKYPDSPFVHICDLVNQETGKTYREENAEKVHNIPIGSLVEIVPIESYSNDDQNDSAGVRLFVVYHARDCDMTPLYSLAIDPSDTDRESDRFYNYKWHNGYPEESLKIIRLPKEKELK